MKSGVNFLSAPEPAKAGDSKLAKVNELIAYVGSWRIEQGHGVRVNRGPRGTHISFWADDSAQWEHPWRVRIEGDSAEVSAGLVNGLMPFLADSEGGERGLDGLDSEGEAHKAGIPKLSIRSLSGETRAWVCVAVTLDASSNKPLDGAAGLTIATATKPTWTMGGSVDEGGRGLYPLAQLRRSAKGEAWEIFQIAMFNLQWRFVEGESQQPHGGTAPWLQNSQQPSGGTTGRHWFWV